MDDKNLDGNKNQSGTGTQLLITLTGIAVFLGSAIFLIIFLFTGSGGKSSSSFSLPDTSGLFDSKEKTEVLTWIPREKTGENPFTKSTTDDQGDDSELKGEFNNISYTKSITGSLYFFGIYENTGKVTISFPRIEIRLMDDNDEVIKKSYGYGSRDLHPGEITPVRILFIKPPEFKKYKAFLSPRKPYSKLTRVKVKIKDLKARKNPNFNSYRATGIITNIDTKTASKIKVFAGLFDAQKKLVGVGTGYIQSKRLEPGMERNFSFRISPVKGKPKIVRLYYFAYEK